MKGSTPTRVMEALSTKKMEKIIKVKMFRRALRGQAEGCAPSYHPKHP
jgi:hypothetical protein